MKRIVFSIVSCVVMISYGYADSIDASDGGCCPRKSIGKNSSGLQLHHFFSLGGARVENSAVNQRLKQLGYSEFSPYGVVFGFGSYRQKRHFIMGHEFEPLFWKPKENSMSESQFSVGRFISLGGFVFQPSPSFAIYPLAGLGVGVSGLKAGPKEIAFDSALSLSSRQPPAGRMYQATFLIDVGLGVHFSKPAPQGKAGRYTIGLRGGYIFDPVDNNKWFRRGVTLSDGPDSDLSGAYLKITFGKSRVPYCHKAASKCPYLRNKCGNTCGGR